jgi:hypothetical protein
MTSAAPIAAGMSPATRQWQTREQRLRIYFDWILRPNAFLFGTLRRQNQEAAGKVQLSASPLQFTLGCAPLLAA